VLARVVYEDGIEAGEVFF